MPVHTETYRGYRIVIQQDDDPQNPRKEYENLGKMVCFHSKYNLGDKHDYKTPTDAVLDITGLDEDDLGLNVTDDLGDGSKHRIVWEPLYLYDHSGITMSTTPFSCRWDSGQVGIVYATYDDIMKNFNIEPIKPEAWEPTKEIIEQVEAILKGEVSTYDNYLTGNVYGYQVFAADEEAQAVAEDEDPPTENDDEYWCDDEEDSCWGFFDYYAAEGGAVAAAKEAIDALIDKG
jgi:hypothetical protein